MHYQDLSGPVGVIQLSEQLAAASTGRENSANIIDGNDANDAATPCRQSCCDSSLLCAKAKTAGHVERDARIDGAIVSCERCRDSAGAGRARQISR
ncbi:MAG: hypothetical protein N2690_09215 [Rhodocyclaceae bacterium]|nr:hypothetical protein [Rhodocyclaceae bacterium]